MIYALSLSNQQEIFTENENTSRVNILSFILYRITYGFSYKFRLTSESQFYRIEEKLKSYLHQFNGQIISLRILMINLINF